MKAKNTKKCCWQLGNPQCIHTFPRTFLIDHIARTGSFLTTGWGQSIINELNLWVSSTPNHYHYKSSYNDQTTSRALLPKMSWLHLLLRNPDFYIPTWHFWQAQIKQLISWVSLENNIHWLANWTLQNFEKSGSNEVSLVKIMYTVWCIRMRLSPPKYSFTSLPSVGIFPLN